MGALLTYTIVVVVAAVVLVLVVVMRLSVKAIMQRGKG